MAELPRTSQPSPLASTPPSMRSILHVDMDAFFAAIAERDDPSLKGQPVLIGGTGPRSVVSTANYIARRYGCGSAMPMAVALRRCPQAKVVHVPGKVIRQASKQVFDVLGRYTDLVQPLSVDEAFMDVTGSLRLFGPPETIAAKIKHEVTQATGGLTCSVGVAFNKFLAKLASDLNKPDGLTVITPDNLDRVLLPLPVSRLWGVGPSTVAKLETMGVHTFADVRKVPEAEWERRLGKWGRAMFHLAHGRDDRPVHNDRVAKSIGQECTFAQDVDDADHVRQVLLGHVEHVGHRLREAGFQAKGVSLKIRYGDFETINRSATLAEATDRTADLWEAAAALFDAWAGRGFRPVRLIGCAAERFQHDGVQMGLFTQQTNAKQSQLDAAMDQIQAKFGKTAVHRGGPRPRK